jgi:hypothetical protein
MGRRSSGMSAAATREPSSPHVNRFLEKDSLPQHASASRKFRGRQTVRGIRGCGHRRRRGAGCGAERSCGPCCQAGCHRRIAKLSVRMRVDALNHGIVATIFNPIPLRATDFTAGSVQLAPPTYHIPCAGNKPSRKCGSREISTARR